MSDSPPNPKLQEASFGGGCFWCVEAFFQRLKGVDKVVSGYQGGTVARPTYNEVTSGRTGHAEVVKVTFDPEVIQYEDLLEVFFAIHDPTTLNRQGNDVGTQYRSVIFTYGEAQNAAAKAKIKKLTEAKTFDDPIVTQVEEAPTFYKAEDYHQNYFRRNPNAPYCRLVIAPKKERIEIRPELLK
ncbi:MAG: peptide-methionine (S)-S-oxide reductase MsrA [Verrucomicrobia bacterium]|nr:peptide-methionine (S)-S-oxide reductase MsrA [Verrucomicrobiota bacterium]